MMATQRASVTYDKTAKGAKTLRITVVGADHLTSELRDLGFSPLDLFDDPMPEPLAILPNRWIMDTSDVGAARKAISALADVACTIRISGR